MAELQWKTGKMTNVACASTSRASQAERGEMVWKKQENKKDTDSRLLADPEKRNILYLKGLKGKQ